MDAARELDIIRRQQDALIARMHEQLEASGNLALNTTANATAVVVHQHEWFVDKVTKGLREGGCEVVAHLVNGADAVGLVAAEQPDLVLVEDRVAMQPGEDVVRQIRALCPDTIIAAQVRYGDGVQPMLDAGAAHVFTRQVYPEEVAHALLALVDRQSSGC